MQREIKFRVWWKGQEKFDYIDSFKKFSSYSFPLDWCIIQQYTGLKDKNEKEIYEGDIVSIYKKGMKTHLYETVQYCEELAVFNICSWKMSEKILGYDFSFEINGNIFENPELIKQ